MNIIKFSNEGKSLGTRSYAKTLRESILNNDEITILDFQGIDVVSNSFADELLGIFIKEHGINELKKKVRIKNTNEEVAHTIKKALSSRIQ